MSSILKPVLPVDYKQASRRHLGDAHYLLGGGRVANAGQLFGFSIECGVKAILIAGGATADATGGIPLGHKYRKHVPSLLTLIAAMLTLPDGRQFSKYQALMPSLSLMSDWNVDHRYWREKAIPLTSISSWELAAIEIDDMLDVATADGIL